MSSFSDTVIFTLEQLLEIIKLANSTQTQINELKINLEQSSEEINQEWDSLKDQIDSLLEQAETVTDNLNKQDLIMENETNNLRGKLETLTEMNVQDQMMTQNSLIAFKEKIQVADNEIFELVEISIASLEKASIEVQENQTEFEINLQQNIKFYTDIIVEILQNNVEKIETSSNSFEELTVSNIIPNLDETTDYFSQSLETIKDQTRENSAKLDPLKEKLEIYLSELMGYQYDEFFDQLLNELSSRLEDKEKEIEDHRNLTLSDLNQLNDKCDDNNKKLSDILEYLNKILSLKEKL
jgi:DNA repair exonuclease SbcCD ATPase subunit